MNRFLSTLRLDIKLQFRNGYYYAALFVVVFWLVSLSFLRDLTTDTTTFVPIFLGINTLVTAFYFVAALVLLEKGEGTLSGLTVTPLQRGEYLWSKVFSLALVALFESSLALAFITREVPYNPFMLLLGLIALSTTYTLIGFYLTSRFNSLNDFLFPSALVIVLLLASLLSELGVPWQWLAWHPLLPALRLIHAGVEPVSWLELAYGLVGTSAWIFFWYQQAYGAFDRFIQPRVGRSV
jgi:fluoroquinolone transport system permease protein